MDICALAEIGDVNAIRNRLGYPIPPSLESLNNRRMTPLMLAASNTNAYNAVTLLLRRGAKANAIHIDTGMTPLHFACGAANAPVAFALLKFGANPSLTDFSGRTPLHWAAISGSPVLIRKLLRRSHGGPQLINVQDASGYTALMNAAEHGREDIVRLLLQWESCNLILRNLLNHTAIELADWFGHRGVCTLLEARMAANGQLSPQTQAVLAAQAQQRSVSAGLVGANNGLSSTMTGIPGAGGSERDSAAGASFGTPSHGASPVTRTTGGHSPHRPPSGTGSAGGLVGGMMSLGVSEGSGGGGGHRGSGSGGSSQGSVAMHVAMVPRTGTSASSDGTRDRGGGAGGSGFGAAAALSTSSGQTSSSGGGKESSRSRRGDGGEERYHVHTAAGTMGAHLLASLTIATIPGQ
jgi:ankyrin repeat protein